MPCPVLWRAPVALTYTPLVMRITVVVDQTTTCEGLYKEIPLASLVECGDSEKDALEGCDDGNTITGDGCDAGCNIELGWTCADFVAGTTKAGSVTRSRFSGF